MKGGPTKERVDPKKSRRDPKMLRTTRLSFGGTMLILEVDGKNLLLPSRESTSDRRDLDEGWDSLPTEEEGRLDATPTKLKRKILDVLLMGPSTEEEGIDPEMEVDGRNELLTSWRMGDRGGRREEEGSLSTSARSWVERMEEEDPSESLLTTMSLIDDGEVVVAVDLRIGLPRSLSIPVLLVRPIRFSRIRGRVLLLIEDDGCEEEVVVGFLDTPPGEKGRIELLDRDGEEESTCCWKKEADAADTEGAAEGADSMDDEGVVELLVGKSNAEAEGKGDGEVEEEGSRATRRCSVERVEDDAEIPRPGRIRSLIRASAFREVDEVVKEEEREGTVLPDADGSTIRSSGDDAQSKRPLFDFDLDPPTTSYPNSLAEDDHVRSRTPKSWVVSVPRISTTRPALRRRTSSS